MNNLVSFPSDLLKKARPLRGLFLSALLLAILGGCAPPPAYTVRLNLPLVPADLPEAAKVVGVVDFEDARAETGRRIGRVTDRDGKKRDILLTEDSIAGSVTTLFKSILRKNNLIVSEVPAWRPAPDGSPAVPRAVDAVIAARIEQISVDVESRVMNTQIQYGFRVVAEIGIRGYDRVILQTVIMEPKVSRPGFSAATVERGLNEYLAEALERLAGDILRMKET